MDKKKVKIFYWIVLVLTALVYFAVLELAKNTLLG